MPNDRIEIDTGTSELLCETHDRVAIITLNRPEARNALSDHLTPALRRMIKQCGDDPAVGALLITGARTAFCAGGEVKWAAIPSTLKHRSTSASPACERSSAGQVPLEDDSRSGFSRLASGQS